jgi:2,3-bisphosphoglycerate-dependent phosphoglycerate mutase
MCEMNILRYRTCILVYIGLIGLSRNVSLVNPFRPVATVATRKVLFNSHRFTVVNNINENVIDDQQRLLNLRIDRNNGYTGTGGYDPLLGKKSLWNKIVTSTNRRTNDNNNSKKEVDEDGWQELRNKQFPLWRRVLRLPFNLNIRALFSNAPVQEVGTLILVRHGESLWNANKTFTGWADPDLSERGYREVEHAARLILEGGYDIDVVFTSRLKRAIRSVWIILQEMNQVYLPVFKSWRLNERMYGALTGLCKSGTAQQLGAELVQEWRGSLKSRPPALKPSDPFWPGRDRKYADLSYDEIPLTESLSDCMERCLPIWQEKILFELRSGKNVLVVAHANTLRGLVKVIDNVSDDDIRDVAIPTG